MSRTYDETKSSRPGHLVGMTQGIAAAASTKTNGVCAKCNRYVFYANDGRDVLEPVKRVTLIGLPRGTDLGVELVVVPCLVYVAHDCEVPA